MLRDLLHRSRILIVAALPLAVIVPTVSAGTQDDAVVTLHAAPHAVTGDPCVSENAPDVAALPCRDFNMTWPLNTSCDLYLVVARGLQDPGIAAVSCGILYNGGETGEETKSDGEGVDLYSWTICTSGYPYPEGWPWQPGDFPASGGGARLTWDASVDCQTAIFGADGVHAVAGVFYVFAYTDDVFEIIPNRSIESNPDEFQVGDCNNQITDLPYPEAAGAVAFGSGTGRNPCQPSPVETSTWSRLKTRYGEGGGGAP